MERGRDGARRRGDGEIPKEEGRERGNKVKLEGARERGREGKSPKNEGTREKNWERGREPEGGRERERGREGTRISEKEYM